MTPLDPWQWVVGATAALLVGVSKTGLPGIGTLVAPMLAIVFGGRQSIGIMLLMLIAGDCFAVLWYRRHAQWDKLVGLLPWVVAGMSVGVLALWLTGEAKGTKDALGVIIGVLTLLMLAVFLVQDRLDDRFAPTSSVGVASTGGAAGFTTMVSNAAGPIMTIYMAAHRLPKKQFIGTLAWYFFVLNLSKVPVYAALTAMNPGKPIITTRSVLFNLELLPLVVAGAFLGRWMLPRISQKAFEAIVLGLAAVSAIKLIVA